MERRKFLTGSAAAVVGASASTSQAMYLGHDPAAVRQPLTPSELEAAVARLRKQFLAEFDPAYVENVIVPWFLNTIYYGEKLWLPMIDVKLTKENALPYDLWGLLSETWKPAPQDGVTVFLQGLEKRGPDNRRKRIYMSAVTPDLYRAMYGDKITQFFDKLLDASNAGKPLMRPYLENYFDLYWDLHLGVKGDAIPARVHEIGQSFNTVLAYRDPTQKIVYQNYMTVRWHLDYLEEMDRRQACRYCQRQNTQPRENFCLLLDQKRRRWRIFRASRCGVRVLSQLRGPEPVGQHHVQHHAEAGEGHRRFRCQGLVQKDHGRQSR